MENRGRFVLAPLVRSFAFAFTSFHEIFRYEQLLACQQLANRAITALVLNISKSFKKRVRRNFLPSSYELQVLTRGSSFFAFYFRGVGKSWAYLGNLDPRLLISLPSSDENDEALDLGHSVAPITRLCNGDVVLLTNFNRLGCVRPKTPAAKARSPRIASVSVTRSFIS